MGLGLYLWPMFAVLQQLLSLFYTEGLGSGAGWRSVL
jgi:hypothetical protein